MTHKDSGSVSASPRPHDIKLIDLQAALPDKAPWRLLGRLAGPAEHLLAVNRVNLLKSVKRSASFPRPGKDAIEDISLLVSELEQDSKGVPTLIKHYLKLNGRFLAFNLDKAFADVIDGLIWVDLLKTEPKIVERFMGTKGALGFYKFHNPASMTKAA